MAITVLVVDDSSFFRRRVSEIINSDPGMHVIDTAVNGKDALDKVIKLKPDVVTMDIEMPVMDGISAVKAIMAQQPTPILMFSSLSHEGAQSTLDALEAGACDFLPKKFEDIARDREEAVSLLQQRVKAISRRRLHRPVLRTAPSEVPSSRTNVVSNNPRSALGSSPTRSVVPNQARNIANTQTSAVSTARPAAINHRASGKRYKLVAIGTSTGGPVALQTILTKLPRNFPHPILLVQHMPATFTQAFATRLNSLCQINVKQAEDGDILQAGCAYLAPGGKQMIAEGRGRIRIVDGNDKVNYKPCVDITFASLAKSHGDSVLAMILTGMGADGRDGAKLLKDKGSIIWAQDEASCVVYGMPQAIAAAGLASKQMPLDRFAESIIAEVGLS
ncbi:chemotaxis response regulator protein-glutamate methylesterase [Alginatibacterium sediminis]|uniref:Protein-glutamate methylesterase/protein-glutamine glutaminase n=1 Tax=Alginatibacterium sediminis TaxID=2164068 RepID=A0A420EFL6_9ALTE|nr:chemotaxis response regulator protein-glutamate methylesterase [Alginatibacterium sediminis]RKF19501.1 chemotaxis response regulator protein-glutamate methylesterase [Alginatibacterium sediminis]